MQACPLWAVLIGSIKNIFNNIKKKSFIWDFLNCNKIFDINILPFR